MERGPSIVIFLITYIAYSTILFLLISYGEILYLKIKEIWLKIRRIFKLLGLFISKYEIILWDIESITQIDEYESIKKTISKEYKSTRQYPLKMDSIVRYASKSVFRYKKILIISARPEISQELKGIIFFNKISIIGVDLGESRIFSEDYHFTYEKEDFGGLYNFFEVALY